MHFPVSQPATREARIPSQLFRCTVYIAGVLVFGSLGYCLIEGWPITDGFYMTMITFSTVGYGETQELSPIGRVYTSGLIFASLVLMACWTAGITTSYVSGELSGKFHARKIKKMIHALSQHSIVFGSGIMAQSVIDRLERSEKPWVVVDDQKETLDTIRRHYPDALIVESSPKNELALTDANVFQAAEVVSVLDSEFDNLLVAMSVKELNPKIRVFTRSDDPRISSRILKAGVDHVICPFQLSGEHVAELVIAN